MGTSNKADQCVASTVESQEIYQHKALELPLKSLVLPWNQLYTWPSDIEPQVLFLQSPRILLLGD